MEDSRPPDTIGANPLSPGTARYSTATTILSRTLLLRLRKQRADHEHASPQRTQPETPHPDPLRILRLDGPQVPKEPTYSGAAHTSAGWNLCTGPLHRLS